MATAAFDNDLIDSDLRGMSARIELPHAVIEWDEEAESWRIHMAGHNALATCLAEACRIAAENDHDALIQLVQEQRPLTPDEIAYNHAEAA